jgi:NitT/TauT family transport system substrate-binding protein
MGLIRGEKGQMGPLEEKYGVDLELKVADYEMCLVEYSNGKVDAVCMTNIDALNPCVGRPGTAIMPTSTSVGADAVISTVATKVADLKKLKTYGLEKSVSEFVFHRGLEVQKENPSDYQFVHLDPGPAATALQSGSSDIKSICVWNPFKLTVLRKNPKAKVIFTSALIPEEVIDMVVVGDDSLKKPKGEDFAALICDIYYQVAAAKDNPATEEKTLKALGEDFCDLSVPDMKICCTETRFYATPKSGIALFGGKQFPKTMEQVIKTCKEIKVIEKESPTIGFGNDKSQLNFTTKFMERSKK